MIEKKEDYGTEYRSLAREQYKKLPKFGGIMAHLGAQGQSLEDVLFAFTELFEDFGTDPSAPRGSFNQTALMLGIIAPERLDLENLAVEIKGALITIYSKGLLSDVNRIPKFLYDYESDLAEYEGGVVLTVYGDISSSEGRKGRVIHKIASRIIPASMKVYSVDEAETNSFGFERFTGSSSWNSGTPVAGITMSQVIIDQEGNYVA